MTARQLERTLADLEREENAWEELDLDMQATTEALGRTAREIYWTEAYGWAVADTSTED